MAAVVAPATIDRISWPSRTWGAMSRPTRTSIWGFTASRTMSAPSTASPLEAVTRIPAERSCPCPDAARYAIMTPAELIPPETRRSLDLLYGKYLKGAKP